MHFDNSIIGKAVQQEDASCDREMLDLLARLNELPANVRGHLALKLSAKLAEFGAFELAGRFSSSEIGELIEMAARMTAQAEDAAEPRRTTANQLTRSMQ